MNLIVQRKYLKQDYTIGRLFVDGVFLCDTLEDTVRDLTKEAKIPGKTAIPAGSYRVIMSFSNRFQRIMPEILDVPGFTGIRMHSGSSSVDTSGCVLLGRNTIKGMLTDSRLWFNRLNDMLRCLNEPITIDIV